MAAGTGLRILFVNHTGDCSGAEHAMLRLLDHLSDEHQRAVACPPGGPLKGILRARGIRHFGVTGTEVSFRLHPLVTPRHMLRLLRSSLEIRKAARGMSADVLHANSVRAGLIAVGARLLGGPPVVVQCHDYLPGNFVGRAIRIVLALGAREVVAVADDVAQDFDKGLRRTKARRVYISLDHQRFQHQGQDGDQLRAELGVPEQARLLAHVAQITPWKGQDISLRTLHRLRADVDAHLLIVGDVAFASQRYDNLGFEELLHDLSRELEIESFVHFLGRRDDVPQLVGAADLLLLPSWREPFGLAAAEAMAVGTPALAGDRGGVREYVRDGVNGRLLDPSDPAAWAQAAAELLTDDELRSRMAKAGVQAVARFNDDRFCTAMLETYARGVRR